MSPVRSSLVYILPSADVTAPGTVSDLALLGAGLDDVTFTATMPGDNGTSGGRPHTYEFRSAASAIVTEGDWTAAAATSWVGEASGMVGYSVEMYLTAQPSGTRYYHVRFTDYAGNRGGISNGVQVAFA